MKIRLFHTENPLASRVPTSLAAFAAAILLTQLVACAPRQFGVDQVPDINVAVTDLKDDAVPGMPAAVDQVVNDYLAQVGAPPGCAVGVMENDQLTRLEGYGFADLGEMRPFTVATPSVVGSVSKTWTALAVLRLQEMNFLDIDDDVSDHLTVPAAWQGITIRQLLSHTSGLAREPVFNPTLDTEVELSQFFFPQFPPIPHLGIHPRLVYPSYWGTPVVGFDPGDTARYSNAGVMILGALVDTIVSANPGTVGEDFAAYESFVWRQVGLFDGTLSNGDQMISQGLNEYWRQNDIPELATGYNWDENNSVYDEIGFQNSNVLQLGPAGWEGPPGGWAMTIGDLVRLMMAIQNDDIITSTTRTQEMMVVHGEDGGSDYGLGVFLIEKLGLPVYMHAGVYPGYGARYTVWPGENFGVAVLCNERNANTRDLTDDIASTFLNGGGGFGGGGFGGGGFGMGVALGKSAKFVPGDDPGLGAEQGDGSEPVPDADEAKQLAEGLSDRERHQLRTENDDLLLVADLEEQGCTDLAAEVIARHGYAVAEPFLACFDTAQSSDELTDCTSRAADDLLAAGVLDRTQHAQVLSCTEVFTGTP